MSDKSSSIVMLLHNLWSVQLCIYVYLCGGFLSSNFPAGVEQIHEDGHSPEDGHELDQDDQTVLFLFRLGEATQMQSLTFSYFFSSHFLQKYFLLYFIAYFSFEPQLQK